MPNWCDNNLLVTGNRQDLERFTAESFSQDEYGRNRFDFEKIVPLGELGDRWYHQHCEQWGTKWNAVDTDFQDTETSISLWFETAWTPPILIMKTLTVKYPALSFTLDYNEGGVGFRGIFKSVQGKVLINNCWDMTNNDLLELGYIDPTEAVS